MVLARLHFARPILLALIASACLGIFAAACGGDDDEETTSTTTSTTTSGAAGEDTEAGVVSDTVDIVATEYALEPTPAVPESLLPGETRTAKVPAGEVTFNITNEGEETHNIVLNLSGEEIPLAEDLAPGDSATASAEVTSGYHVILCTDPGHQDQGMSMQIDVE